MRFLNKIHWFMSRICIFLDVFALYQQPKLWTQSNCIAFCIYISKYCVYHNIVIVSLWYTVGMFRHPPQPPPSKKNSHTHIHNTKIPPSLFHKHLRGQTHTYIHTHHRDKIRGVKFNFNCNFISPSLSYKNLGVMIDNKLYYALSTYCEIHNIPYP